MPLQLRSLVRPSSELEVSLADVPMPEPAADEVVVRVEAAPINPSDLILMLGPTDPGTARYSGTPDRPVITLPVSERAMPSLAARVGQSLPVGNEGAGVVVAAGSSAAAQALLGRTVAILGGSMFTQFRCMKADQCLLLPEGTTAAEGGDCFVNPLTALGMTETMRMEGHTAIVHTAAASNLGQMLLRICQKDGIPLVNIVRKEEQVQLLRSRGATWVCNSSAPTFLDDLTEALAATGATIAFDATGGGALAGQILACMEAAINRSITVYNRYGSTTLKQVYIYGRLDSAPVELSPSRYGFAWSLAGWLLTPFLQKVGPEGMARLRARVVAELKTTFASHYTQTVSLAGALRPEAVAAYARRATGEKFLINPSLD